MEQELWTRALIKCLGENPSVAHVNNAISVADKALGAFRERQFKQPTPRKGAGK